MYDFQMDESTPKKRGPKPMFGVPMKRTQITIDNMTRRKLVAVGGDVLSEAIRTAADMAYDAYQNGAEKKTGQRG